MYGSLSVGRCARSGSGLKRLRVGIGIAGIVVAFEASCANESVDRNFNSRVGIGESGDAAEDRNGVNRTQSGASRFDLDIVGKYLHTHEVSHYVGDQERIASAVDCFSLYRAEDGGLRFHLVFVSTNFHSCEMEGRAERSGEVLRIFDPDTACAVAVRAAEDEFIFDADEPVGCSFDNYCGSRASIRGVKIPRKGRVVGSGVANRCDDVIVE